MEDIKQYKKAIEEMSIASIRNEYRILRRIHNESAVAIAEVSEKIDVILSLVNNLLE